MITLRCTWGMSCCLGLIIGGLHGVEATAADFVASTDHGLPSYAAGAPVAGDVDNDGDLDLVFSHSGAERHTWVFFNDGAGRFTNSGQELEPLDMTVAALGDYDGDGWLDLALTGTSPGGSPLTRLYRNNRNGTFATVNANLVNVRSAALAWADFDRDGDLDLVVSGVGVSGVQSAVYRNNGAGMFTEIPGSGVGSVGEGAVAAADFDGDADLDLWMAGGNVDGQASSSLVMNRGDATFDPWYSGSRPVWGASVAWADVNNDGWPDVIQTGALPSGVSTEVWRNDGAGGFVLLLDLSPAVGLEDGNAAWGDYDNDGRPDLLLAGFNGVGDRFTRVLRNVSNGPVFTNLVGALPSVGINRTYAQWGDFNGDSKLDILLCGNLDGVHLLRNNRATANTPPAAPANLTATFANDVLTLRWTRPSDAQTPSLGLHYNVRLGTSPGAGNILSPSADAVTGRRRLVARGNAGSTNFWQVKGLASGTYYWSVQAIDSAFAGSTFAPERAVVVNRPPTVGAVADVTSPANTVIGPLPFVITDVDSPLATVVVSAASSNPQLIPASGIALAGSNGDRTVTLTPVPNRVGTAVITLTATDASGNSASRQFNVLVPNTPPLISSISNRTILISRTAPLIHFTVGDVETPASNLVLTAHSVIQEVIPDANIVFGGSGSNRTVQITPAPGALGGTTVWIDVRDSDGGTNRGEFIVNVADLIEVVTGLPGVEGRALAWGDFDSDGNLDLALGEPDGTGYAAGRIYRNTGGAFVSIDAPLVKLAGPSLAWGDPDRDGDLDLAWNGRTTNGAQLCFLYRNDGAAGFSAVATLPGGGGGFVLWADADNDGDADLLLNGDYDTRLHINDGSGGWPEMPLGIRALTVSAGAWGDYDNDGDLDFVVGGQEPRTCTIDNPTCALRYRTELYRNEGGRFTLAQSFPGIAGGTLSWGDRDRDGDLDLLLTGISQDATTRLYENRGSGGFLDTASPLRWAPGGYAAWGDFENDGDLDLLYGGYALFGLFSTVMINEPGTFYESRRITSFYAASFGAWGDYDNDGDLDAMVMDSGAAHLFRNETVATNTPPLAPSGVRATLGPRSARLAWDAPTDANQVGGLTYNLRVGRTPGAIDILAPLSDPITGRRRVQTSGNAGEASFWGLTNLAFGTYYWSVQAVDNSFAGSPFATEGSFTITNHFPAITDLQGQAVQVATLQSSAPLAFSIRDGETDATNLVLSAFSSNPTLVPAANITFGGSGHDRFVSMASEGLRPGTATITIMVTDEHGATAHTQFFVEVWSRPPNLSTIEPQVVPVNGSLAVPFVVWDFETPASELILTAASSDTELVSLAGLAFGGAGLNRSLLVTPVPHRTGTVELTISARDADGTNSATSFVLTVTNTPPILSIISNQVLYPGTSTPDIPFTVSDAETPAVDLVVSAFRGDGGPPLDVEISVGGTGANRTVRVRSLLIQRGSFNVNVVAIDPYGRSTTRTFAVALGEFTPGGSAPSSSVAAWGDDDGDGDLDLLLGGASPVAAGPRIYRQTSGAYSNANVALQGLSGVRLAWGDFDRDGDLDFAMTGAAATGRPCLVYLNQGTNYLQAASLSGTSDGAIAWGDFDNDGDLDLVVAGQSEKSTNATLLYRNLGGTNFAPVPAGLTPLGQCALAWGDADGDGDLDLLGAGSEGQGIASTILFRNNGGSFARQATGIPGVREGSLAWGDYDQDGDPDVLVTGWNVALAQPVARVYRNDGAGQFADANVELSGVYRSSAAWGDYDNDGDLDIVLAGNPGTGALGRIYRNEAGDFADIGWSLPVTSPGLVAWGDADADGDLDLLLGGVTGSAGGIHVFQNNIPVANARPTPPVSLTSAGGFPNNQVTLQWLPGADAETLAAGLTYNLRVGTHPGGGDVASPHAGSDGMRRLPAMGAASARTRRLELPRGSYYWSVQAIDANLAGSSFAAEGTFIITNSAPRISEIAPRLTLPGSPLPPVPFTLSDDEDPVETLVVTVRSSNTNLLPNAGIGVTGIGSNRTLSLSPTPDVSGVTTITIIAVDSGGVSAERSFEFVVETFTPLPLNAPGVSRSAGSWIDHDSDGDLDALIAGVESVGSVIPRMYRNDGEGGFTNIPVSLGRLALGTISWADYDRDRDLDLLLGGELYRNTGTGSFSGFQTVLGGSSAGYALWGDYDNNGVPDVLWSNADQPARLYRNGGGGSFSNLNLTLPSVSRGAAWSDFDGDGDLDFAMSSTVGSPASGRIFRNDGNAVFIPVATNVVSAHGPVAWGDFDADGDPDLLASGTNRTRLYRNDGGQTFFEMPASFAAAFDGSLSWGDFDNDGDLDVVLTGLSTDGGSAVTRVYRNNGGGTFTDTQADLAGVSGSSASWGDFDRDGDLDLLLTGTTNRSNTGGTVRIYRNNFNTPNAAPGAPAGLVSSVTGDAVALAWEAASTPDDHTPRLALTYNLRVGTSPGGVEIISPDASSPSGARRLAEPGAVGSSRRWNLTNLMPGEYYWSVQAIDSAFVGSAFSPEQTFTVTNTLPIALAQAITLSEDTSTNLFLQAIDPDRQTLVYQITLPPTHGLLTGTLPSVVYRPASNYYGPDSFAWTVSDGLATSAPASVSVTVLPVQDATEIALAIQMRSGGATVTLRGEPRTSHRIEISADLVTWTEVATVEAATDGSIRWEDPAPPVQQRFYRARTP